MKQAGNLIVVDLYACHTPGFHYTVIIWWCTPATDQLPLGNKKKIEKKV